MCEHSKPLAGYWQVSIKRLKVKLTNKLPFLDLVTPGVISLQHQDGIPRIEGAKLGDPHGYKVFRRSKKRLDTETDF